ncbi:MAG: hypothetical protein ACXWBO_06535 [Ilumatobacteraceae bacterium]
MFSVIAVVLSVIAVVPAGAGVVAAGAGVFELLPHAASPATAITVIVTARLNPFTPVLLDLSRNGTPPQRP